MPYVIFCTDQTERDDLRPRHRPAHLDYIREHLDKVILAGPTMNDAGDKPNGSMLVMDFETLDDAKAFAENDPYFQGGVFENVVIRPWKKIFPED